jgi:ABC transport system ATP-binding/permease protein
MVKYYNPIETGGAYSFYHNKNIPVYFFMSVVVALFFGLTMSAEEIFKDRKILKREQFLRLSRSSYLTSKVCVMFFISAIQTFLFIVVGNSILEIPLQEVRYWIILFTCSCFANMLGLNISASFNSAVTIYILIPLLIIPQLLLSGVVISFDKFNPRVTKPIGVPFAGEIMASRWAFEAFMVTQFRDNKFEKRFYDLDKIIGEAEYKRVYYIPALESKLAYCLNNRSQWRNPRHVRMNTTLTLLRNEIGNELKFIGNDKFPHLDDLNINEFDSTSYDYTFKFLSVLKRYYGIKLSNAVNQKERRIASFTTSPSKTLEFEAERMTYTNEAVTDAVLNVSTTERIVEYNGALVQKIYPIYRDDHYPKHVFDFSANLYQPTKHFGGYYWDTLYFNVMVIWSMTAVLFVTLYYDVLRRIVRQLEGNRRFKRKPKE